MIKKKNYIWVSDYSNTTGEGNLAHLFIKIKLKKDFECVICKFKSKNKFYKIIFGYKYFLPLLGILNCWKYYLKGETVSYINYLPLWNVLIFLFLPPKTILGPITGGSYFKKDFNLNYIIRNFIFPIFYKISNLIIYTRNFENIFATNLLKVYLSKNSIKKSSFNFVLNGLKKHIPINKKKNIDFVIYFRNHKNKKNLYPINFIKKLINYDLKISVIGDKLKIRGINNLGYLSKNKLNKILAKSKFSICSGENLYSLFTIDCINNNVKVISNIKPNTNNKHFDKSIIYVKSFKNLNESKIYHIL